MMIIIVSNGFVWFGAEEHIGNAHEGDQLAKTLIDVTEDDATPEPPCRKLHPAELIDCVEIRAEQSGQRWPGGRRVGGLHIDQTADGTRTHRSSPLIVARSFGQRVGINAQLSERSSVLFDRPAGSRRVICGKTDPRE